MGKQGNPSKEETDSQVKLIKASSRRGLITRTSQACDRCRIKKIKCDGKIPSCTNCLSIGYNCQTSDKLTRRSFPKCYTESLEKTLITLQNENAKLIHENDLLKNGGEQNSFGLDSAKNIPSVDEVNSTSLNFFRYDNILLDDCYIGLNSFETLYKNICSSQGIEIQEKPNLLQHNLSSLSVTDILEGYFIGAFPLKSELDMIISNHFETFNCMLPILDEDLFYSHYTSFFKSINNETSNIASFLKHTEDEKVDLFIILIVIIQLNTQRFQIQDLYNLICATNFHQDNTIINFQALLLALQLFQSNGVKAARYTKLVTNISNLSLTKVIGMGLHLNYNNLTKINDPGSTPEPIGRCNIYAIRLKLYWSCYSLNILNNLSFGHSNLKFLSSFDNFHVPRISSLINSSNDTSSLKTFDKFTRLVQSFNDINILSDNVYRNNITSLLQFQEKELGIRDDNTFIREMEYLIMGKSFNQDNYVKLQLQFMAVALKFLLDINDDENSITFLKMFKILSDYSKSFRSLSNSSIQFNMFPLDISRMCLMAFISVLSKRSSSQVTTSLKYLIISVLKILKNCYVSVFTDNQAVIRYVKEKTDSSDEDLKSNSTVSLSLSTICKNNTGNNSSLYNKSLQTTGLFSHLQNYRTYSASRALDSDPVENSDYTPNTSSILSSIHIQSQNEKTLNTLQSSHPSIW
ncbi:hypothetical protein WICPIJ_004843 [Wickerhamomyces pijperi]|uniref:Zn(2)-C6 fungal-type domain-containing protein n=1 Tax=Wickerhamomyces pijperi TaxID=599730 RepID=A0A9P8TMI6_WICPI|nr:hypothetical protein WICPIJ_004843 [Wickerhamomyces pijperi]